MGGVIVTATVMMAALDVAQPAKVKKRAAAIVFETHITQLPKTKPPFHVPAPVESSLPTKDSGLTLRKVTGSR
jgi:hypothetical protein